MLIAIDAGHGLNTIGKRIPNVLAEKIGFMREWEFNSSVAVKVCTLLKSQYGIDTYRSDDITGKTDVDLNIRTSNINNKGCVASVSIHANAGGGTGIETYIYDNSKTESIKFANIVQKSLLTFTKMKNRGVRYGNFAMVRSIKCPAILVECGFMDTTSDAQKLLTNDYRELCAKAIVDGIVKYLNLKSIESELDKSLKILKTKKIITDTKYWKNATKSLQYLEKLMISCSQKNESKILKNKSLDFVSSLDILVKYKVIQTPDYWIQNKNTIENLEGLIINMGNSFV